MAEFFVKTLNGYGKACLLKSKLKRPGCRLVYCPGSVQLNSQTIDQHIQTELYIDPAQNDFKIFVDSWTLSSVFTVFDAYLIRE